MTYTREQILAMDAEQLAEATAIHVMGWRKEKPSNYPYDYGGHWLDSNGDWQYDCDNSHDEIWNPAEDIAAAWEMEECIKQKYYVGLYGRKLKYVLLSTGDYIGMFDYIHATAEQRCKAALLAVLDL